MTNSSLHGAAVAEANGPEAGCNDDHSTEASTNTHTTHTAHRRAGSTSTNTNTNPAHSEPFEAARVYPVIPGRLGYAAHANDDMTRREIESNPSTFFWSEDHQDLYYPFCADFGPVNLSVVHSFCRMMHAVLSEETLQGRQLVYYSNTDPAERTNTAFLLAAFLVIDYGATPEEAWAPFASIGQPPSGWGGEGCAFETYHDATHKQKTYGLTVLSCLRGLRQALVLGWYMPADFDPVMYEYLDDPSFADMHALCPKFVAFKGPSGRKTRQSQGVYSYPPAHYAPLLRDGFGCGTVVRLNEASSYDAEGFTREGLDHHDLYFDDCTVPPRALVDRFLELCDECEGRVAVHCLAGLGRTGTLIAVYWMKHFSFTAGECIGWMRIVRPGCIIGRQQQYLERVEVMMKRGTWESGAEVDGMETGVDAEAAMMGAEVERAQIERAMARLALRGEGVVEADDVNSDSSTVLSPHSQTDSSRNSLNRLAEKHSRKHSHQHEENPPHKSRASRDKSPEARGGDRVEAAAEAEGTGGSQWGKRAAMLFRKVTGAKGNH